MSSHPVGFGESRDTSIEELGDESLDVFSWEDLLRFGDGHVVESGLDRNEGRRRVNSPRSLEIVKREEGMRTNRKNCEVES